MFKALTVPMSSNESAIIKINITIIVAEIVLVILTIGLVRDFCIFFVILSIYETSSSEIFILLRITLLILHKRMPPRFRFKYIFGFGYT